LHEQKIIILYPVESFYICECDTEHLLYC